MKKKVPIPLPVKLSQCFLCDGSGQICDVCGESEKACECGGESTFSDCEDCNGTGK